MKVKVVLPAVSVVTTTMNHQFHFFVCANIFPIIPHMSYVLVSSVVNFFSFFLNIAGIPEINVPVLVSQRFVPSQ